MTALSVRRPAIDLDVPSHRYWFQGAPALTCFAYAMSAVFPVGERFFIQAVRRVEDRITDPALVAEARAFVGQEGQHAALHARYNARAAADGFAVAPLAEGQERAARVVTRVARPELQLAITAAFEHFTAIMASQILGGADIMAGIPSPHRELWHWHSVEEAEHKSVAFDVYMAVDGSYVRRVAVYLLVSLSFAAMTLLRTWYLMARDGTFASVRAQGVFLRWLLVSPGVLVQVLPRWVAYLAPGFHPSAHDDVPLIRRWMHEAGVEARAGGVS